ncbi:cytochrome c oxidase subunit II [Mesorhizobium sp. B4-1-4]|uniref:cytochrome c oxidase subunit II n=1 Tax=Mesorhizobium sp. B4-1-4 TaxID=2589888 RepID=UPI00112866CB|nr:cytochrome c oxidase subunit II [Mesorhizobium sp. B4-1-4]UCI29782.1 cytochrome c oxidase subunit II [Mesorhizobium sp. B4-1-4]
MGKLRCAGGIGALAVLLSGCSQWQSALHPQGGGARAILGLIWLFTAVSVVVWVLVVMALTMAVLHRRRGRQTGEPLATDRRREQNFFRVVATAVAVTIAVLIGLTFASFLTGKSNAALNGEALTIHLTGHQWWWEARYHLDGQSDIVTANEIHLPVDLPIRVELDSADVIHSFWVPSLAGKRDLIPGRPGAITLLVEKAGTYRGQCAEFCGYQHTHMAMTVVAEGRSAFDAWVARQRLDAVPPKEEEARRGQAAFLGTGCALCHRIRGTPAVGVVGPDLTHLASRGSLAADTLPLTRGALAAWIADPQSIKPGAKMPSIDLSANDLNAVVAYLEGLQ